MKEYKRTPTKAKLRVTFSNGEQWDIPAQIIADDRDKNYADEQEDTAGFIRDNRLDNYELTDWANNNMNWEDVAAHAIKVEIAKKIDYEDEWCNAEKEIVGDI